MMMKHLFLLVALLLGLSLSAFAQTQSKLPPCPKEKNVRWNDCFGAYTAANGDNYVGEFKDNKKHGQGVYIYPDGTKYVGEHKDNYKHGQGTLTFTNGDKYVGEFKDDNINGQGTYTRANGSQYVGEWKDSKYHGRGIETYEDGRPAKEGIWQEHKLVHAEKVNLPPDNQQTYVAMPEERRILESDRQALNNSTKSDWFVIQPQFAWVGDFKEELAPVKIGVSGKYGFIDKQGKFIINPQFDYASILQEGLAAIRIGDEKTGKWGFVDKQGRMIINPQFDFTFSFQEGLAVFRNFDSHTGKYGYIDKQGKIIIHPQFVDAMGFSEGLAAVLIGDYKTGKWGFIDKRGKMIIKPEFYAPYSRFNEGLAPVRTGDATSGKYGFIDKQGRMIITPQFAFATYFKDGLAVVKVGNDKTGKYGYIDKQGKMIINPQFDSAKLFEEGLAAVRIGDEETGKYGFIDKEGKIIINPQFDEVTGFKEGLAAVRIGNYKTGKWGYIDKNGKIIIDAQYDNSMDFSQDIFILSNSFSDGLAPSCIKENLIRKCGFITKNVVQSSKLATAHKEQKQQDENKLHSSKLSLQTTTTNPDANGVVIISVRTNADTSSLKVNGEEQGGRPDGNYVIKKVARVGQDTNYFITAVDTNGNTDSTTITVARQVVSSSYNQSASLKPENIKRAPARDAVAIIIGIQNYKRVPKAEFANNDAKEFYEYAIRGLGIKPENIKLLLDEEADEVNIVKAFENWLPLQVNKNKTDVYVFYSGHGLPSNDGKSLYFLPHGVDKELLSRTAVGQNEVVSALVASKPKSVTMFIDACYSGQTRGGETLLASAKPLALKADTNVFPSNFTVITASANDQISSSSPELKHGIFSFYLMKGMEGDADGNKDGKITAGEMQEYLQDKVSRQAMSMSRKQDTQLVGDANRVLMGR